MNRKQSVVALSIPTLGAIVHFIWLIGLPLFISGRHVTFPDTWVYFNVCIMMFGLEAWIWVTIALASYGIGFWIVLASVEHPKFKGVQILGLLFTTVPLILIGLSPFFADYYGP